PMQEAGASAVLGLAAIGIGVFVLASLFVGFRLLLLWLRTRDLPELCAGLALILLGPVGFSLSLVSIELSPTQPGVARTCMGIGMVAGAAGSSVVAFFTQTVFRHGRLWRAATVGTVLVLAASCIGAAVGDDLDILRTPGLWRNAAQVVEIGVFLWGAT